MTTIAPFPSRLEDSQVTAVTVHGTDPAPAGVQLDGHALPALIFLITLLVFLAIRQLGRAAAPVIEVIKAAAAAMTGALLLVAVLALLVTALVLSVG